MSVAFVATLVGVGFVCFFAGLFYAALCEAHERRSRARHLRQQPHVQEVKRPARAPVDSHR